MRYDETSVEYSTYVQWYNTLYLTSYWSLESRFVHTVLFPREGRGYATRLGAAYHVAAEYGMRGSSAANSISQLKYLIEQSSVRQHCTSTGDILYLV